jgi:hypothetical protein
MNHGSRSFALVDWDSYSDHPADLGIRRITLTLGEHLAFESKTLAAAIAAAVAMAAVMLPADARTKKQKRSAWKPQQAQQAPSLDGRVTGRTRTCWFDTLQYDGLGVPYGPYCH